MVLRPDEEAAEAEKYRNERFNSNLKTGAKAALSVGTAVAAPMAAARILPFLSEYVPLDLAMKGINKLAPKVGAFLKRGQAMGLDLKEGLDFVKEKMQPKEEEKKEPAKPNGNIIQQYSPELHDFISQEVSKGRSPIEAAAVAQNNNKFSKIIEKLSKDHKTPWSQIVEGIYGSGQYGGAVNPPQQNQQQAQPMQAAQGQQAPQQQGQPHPNSAQGQQMARNQAQQGQPGQQQGGLDPAVAQLIQEGTELIKRARQRG